MLPLRLNHNNRRVQRFEAVVVLLMIFSSFGFPRLATCCTCCCIDADQSCICRNCPNQCNGTSTICCNENFTKTTHQPCINADHSCLCRDSLNQCNGTSMICCSDNDTTATRQTSTINESGSTSTQMISRVSTLEQTTASTVHPNHGTISNVQSSKDGLNTSTIVAIVFGSVVILIICFTKVYVHLRAKRTRRRANVRLDRIMNGPATTPMVQNIMQSSNSTYIAALGPTVVSQYWDSGKPEDKRKRSVVTDETANAIPYRKSLTDRAVESSQLSADRTDTRIERNHYGIPQASSSLGTQRSTNPKMAMNHIDMYDMPLCTDTISHVNVDASRTTEVYDTVDVQPMQVGRLVSQWRVYNQPISEAQI